MRVEHYDIEQQKVFVLMKDTEPRPIPLPDPTDFAACLAYWSNGCDKLDIQIKKTEGKDRQALIVKRDHARAQRNKYKHLAPRRENLNAELPSNASS